MLTYRDARYTTITAADLYKGIFTRLQELRCEPNESEEPATIEFDFCGTRLGEIVVFTYDDPRRVDGAEEHVGIRMGAAGRSTEAREFATRLRTAVEDNEQKEVQGNTPVWVLGREERSETGIRGVHREGSTLVVDTVRIENRALRIVQPGERPYFMIPVRQEEDQTIFQRETVIGEALHLHQLALPIAGATVDDNWSNHGYWMQARYVLSASCVMTTSLTHEALRHKVNVTRKEPRDQEEVMKWAAFGQAFKKVRGGMEDVVWARLNGRDKLVWLGLKRLIEMWINLRALRAGGEGAIKAVWDRDKALIVHERGAKLVDHGVQLLGGDAATPVQNAVSGAFKRIGERDPEWLRNRNADFWWIPELGRRRKTLREVYEWTRRKGIGSALDGDGPLAGIMEMAWYMCNYISHEMRTPIDTLEVAARRGRERLRSEHAVEGWEMMIAHGIAIDVHNVVTGLLGFEARGTREVVGALQEDVTDLVLGGTGAE
ncbi:MAG: hypothetical protein OXH52_05710 [Gammaproteobacteria bacterium]|nr:hypothetical protein [Gammaproteobacteria bacterium]